MALRASVILTSWLVHLVAAPRAFRSKLVLAKFRDEVIRVDSAEDAGSDKAAAGDYGGAGGTGAIVESSGDSSTV